MAIWWLHFVLAMTPLTGLPAKSTFRLVHEIMCAPNAAHVCPTSAVHPNGGLATAGATMSAAAALHLASLVTTM